MSAAKSIPTAISAGAALAVTSALIDAGGQTTRIDNGKEYYPYTQKKRPTVTNWSLFAATEKARFGLFMWELITFYWSGWMFWEM